MKVRYANMDNGKWLNVWVYDNDILVCHLNVIKQRFGYSVKVNNPPETLMIPVEKEVET